MADDRPSASEGPSVPEAAVAPRRGISIVWIIPLVAALIGGWLAYKTLSERGPTITISFETAEGLEAGKTKIKYKDVEVGLVDAVRLGEELSDIAVTAKMSKEVAPHLTDKTRFWVVRPRVGAGGVSGLGTLVSGAFIEVDFAAGQPARSFVGLEEPPPISSDEPGRRFTLQAETLGSISRGAPVLYRGFNVGQVLGYKFSKDSSGVAMQIFIHSPYDKLVKSGSRFWNASGFEVSVGAEGFSVRTGTFQSLLVGGIEFDSPHPAGEPSAEGAEFPLYESFAAAGEARFTRRLPFLVHFEGSVRGLRPGAPVEFQGLKVGIVSDVRLEYDPQGAKIRVPVVLQIEPQRLTFVGQGETQPAPVPYEGMKLLVERGLRAQLKSGSLLTGELLVALDFHPESPPAELKFGGQYPEIPTVPTELEELTRSVSRVLEKLANLPLQELVAEMQATVKSVNALVSSPSTTQAADSLGQSLATLQATLQTIDREIGPLAKSLRATSDEARAMIAEVKLTATSTRGFVAEADSVPNDLTSLLRELAAAARSIRVLADYLERHPEALIRGKGAPPGE